MFLFFKIQHLLWVEKNLEKKEGRKKRGNIFIIIFIITIINPIIIMIALKKSLNTLLATTRKINARNSLKFLK
jgi:hypothetical protein